MNKPEAQEVLWLALDTVQELEMSSTIPQCWEVIRAPRCAFMLGVNQKHHPECNSAGVGTYEGMKSQGCAIRRPSCLYFRSRLIIWRELGYFKARLWGWNLASW